MRILIVDDHTLMRKGLIHIIQNSFTSVLQIDEAECQTEAETQLRSNSYDLVLLDVSLGGRSGLDILGWINKERPSLPVLVVSMHPEDQYALRALKLGASGYLTKHSAPSELMTAINQILVNGKYVSPKLSILLANEFGNHIRSQKANHQLLSNREMEIACMIARGMSAKKIAEALNLSVKTVNTYRSRLLKKLNIQSNAELTSFLISNRFIDI